jgi:hypothetical protein
MNELSEIKKCIKAEVEKVKENLLKSSSKNSIRFFLDSIKDDIKSMIRDGLSYKQQVEIINKSSEKNIKYNTYIRYVNSHVLKSHPNKKVIREDGSKISDKRVKFVHESMPNKNNLY